VDVVVKPTQLPTLMTVATISLTTRYVRGNRLVFVIAGLVLGICSSTRSLYGPLVPVVLSGLYREFPQFRANYALTLSFYWSGFGLLPLM